MHLFARDAGAGRRARCCEAFWKAGADCASRRDVSGDCANIEGRMRRRRSVTGIVAWGGGSEVGNTQKLRCAIVDD